MSLDDISQQMLAARMRAAALYQEAGQALVQQQELLIQSFEELYTALENLEETFETLRQQNLELTSVRSMLALERQHHQKWFELIPDAYLMTDGKGIIQQANSAAAILLDIPQHLLVGKPLVALIAKKERQTFLTKLTRQQQWNQKSQWEVRFSQRHGKPINVVGTANTIYDSQGNLLALCWRLSHIEQRQQALAQWLLTDVVQQANEAILITSAELNYPGPKVVFVNSAFTKMSGYTLEQMIGKTPRILQGPQTNRSVLEQLRRNLLQGQLFCGEIVNYRQDGTEYNVQLWCNSIHNDKGDITHFVSIQRSIP